MNGLQTSWYENRTKDIDVLIHSLTEVEKVDEKILKNLKKVENFDEKSLKKNFFFKLKKNSNKIRKKSGK